jgi:hypothetical protein
LQDLSTDMARPPHAKTDGQRGPVLIASQLRAATSVVRRYLSSCFLLLVPILVWNLLLASRLPPAFQGAEFWRDIPRWVSVPENVLRLLVFVLAALMPLELPTRRQRVRLAVFAAGVAAYFASWAVLITWPSSAWSTSAPGFLAPAYTPALWLFGLGLLSDRLFITALPFRRWMFFALAAGFLAFHNLHTAIVYARNF